MKTHIFTLFLLVMISSCCRDYYCVKGNGIGVEFIGYSKSDRDHVTLFLYEKNNQFNHVIDSLKQPGLFYDTTSAFYLQDLNYDYALKCFTDTFYISNIEEEITSFRACFGESVKMGECGLLYEVRGNKITKSADVVTITK